MIAHSRKHWTVAILLLITLLVSVQLLRYSRSSDATFIPSKWQDWASSRWRGGEPQVPEPQLKGDKSSPTSISTEWPSPTAVSQLLATQQPVPDGFDATTQMFDLNKPTHDPAGPRPDQIVLLTATDGLGHNSQIKDVVDMALHNRREYCEVHGYINHFINMSRIEVGADPVWKKLPAIIETFQTYPDAQWVWWLDLDAIIMTPEYKLEEKILSDAALKKILLRHEEYRKGQNQGVGVFSEAKPVIPIIDLLVAQDHSTINAGSFMLRRSAWTQKLLTAWYDPLLMDHGFPMQEQDALIHLLTTNPDFRKRAGLVSPRVLNAFWSGWSKGDLLIHFAGCWTNDHCQRNWNAVWKQRYGTLEFPPPKNESTEAVVTEGKAARRGPSAP